jgi:hypothetical protein
MYYPVIEQFVNYIQVLPASQQGLFSDTESLLDYSLSRATYTVTLSLSHLYPKEKDFCEIILNPEKAVELYAAFTAALFKEVGLLIHYYQITIYDSNEQLLQVWNPFESSLYDSDKACFFSFKFIEGSQQSYLTPGALASFILYNHPKTRPGFLAMTKYLSIYEAWLAALIEETYRVPLDSIITLLPFAEKQAIEHRLYKKLKLEKNISSNKKNLFYLEQINSDRKLGEQFLKWLREGVESGRISVNSQDEKGVRKVAAGIFIARSELIAFSELHHANPDVVEKQFQEIMALYSVGRHAKPSIVAGGMAQAMLGQWLLAYNPALIFSLGNVPALFTSPYFNQYTTINQLITYPVK